MPSVNQAYSMIVWEERQCIIACGKEDKVDAVSFAARTMKPNSDTKNLN